jgi:hypothetical protein
MAARMVSGRGNGSGNGSASPRFQRWLGKLSADERIRHAKDRADKLVGHTATLFLMREAKALGVYSPKLARKIPRSHAAHAFNQFRRSMHLFEIIRLLRALGYFKHGPGKHPHDRPVVQRAALVDQIARQARPLCQPSGTSGPR